MKKLIILLVLLRSIAAMAQAPDSGDRAAVDYFHEADRAAKNQHLWKKPLYGPILFVEPATRIVRANTADSAGILKPVHGLYKGVLPKEVMIANTAIDWEGKKWSVMLWPLPGGHDDDLNLILHESFHRIQEDLGLPAKSPAIAHLDNLYGRIYFLLELQALKAALSKPLNARTADLANAWLFREKRKQLFPNTFYKEHELEMNEGLAEFTGVILGRPRDSIRNHLYQVIDGAAKRASLIRAAAYFTGPVYGFLLSERQPGWTLQVDSNSDFPALMIKYYGVKVPQMVSEQELSKRIKLYNGEAIIASEKLREEEHQQRVARYREAFTKKPVLVIKLQKMNINFNPNNLFDLGDMGTVYPTSMVKDLWGVVTVTENGMLMKDWKVISLPISDTAHLNGNVIEQSGWNLTLSPGYEIVKEDELHYRLQPK